MLVSTLDWIIHIPMILQVRVLKVVFVFSGPSQLKLSLAGLIRWWPKWLTNIHELCLDCTDLITTAWGLTLTGMVTNQAWTKWAAQSTSHTFQALKIIFLFPHISHMNCFLYPWTFLRAKKYLICELFSSSLPPSSTQKCWSWAVSPQASSGCFMHHW